MIVTYKEIVDTVQQACDDNIAVKSFAEGAIDYLDAHAVNIVYPFVFMRPLASPGLQNGVRTLNFELYMYSI